MTNYHNIQALQDEAPPLKTTTPLKTVCQFYCVAVSGESPFHSWSAMLTAWYSLSQTEGLHFQHNG